MLYEKPFVNVAVYNENDWTEIVDSTKMDSIGFFNGDASLCLKTMKEIREEPLLFHSASLFPPLASALWPAPDSPSG